jgi:peptidoglycan/LPS O-acetylase OafA/YrhL
MNFLLILTLGFGVCILLMARESETLSSRYIKVSKFLGKYSYGIYVRHVPMANSITLVVKNIYPDSQLVHSQLLHLVLTFLLSTFASQAVIRLIEVPLRRKVLKYL